MGTYQKKHDHDPTTAQTAKVLEKKETRLTPRDGRSGKFVGSPNWH